MITAVVRFPLPASVSLEDATALFEGSAPKYKNLPGLIRKYYLYGEEGENAGFGGGVYLWESREAAEKVYNDDWKAMIAERYGASPDIQYFQSPVIVDNS